MLTVVMMVGTLGLHAEYSDHRNRHVDSLEMVLRTRKPSGKELYRIYDGLMNGYLQTDGSKSAHYATLGIEMAEKNGWLNALTDSWRVLGLNAYGAMLYDSAQHCLDHALKAATRMEGDRRYTRQDVDDKLSALYGTLGNLYNMQGQLHLALDYYQKALPIFQRNGWKESESILHYNVGELYLELGNDSAAEENYRRALEVGRATGDSLMMCGPHSGLAMTCLNTGRYKAALEHARWCLAYYEAHSEEELEGLMDGYVLMSRIQHLGYGRLDVAQQYVARALQLADHSDARTNVCDAMAQQASLCLARSEWAEAVAWARRALDTADQDPQHNIGLYRTLAEAHAAMANRDSARHYIGLMHDTMEEQATTKYQAALSEMEVRYHTLEQEAELRDLEQRHRMARLQNWIYLGLIVAILAVAAFVLHVNRQRQRIGNMMARMQGEADERTRLGRDLHDRLGGLLTSIQMQAESEQVQHLSRLATEEMRRVAHHLLPASLQERGLATALREFCRVNRIVTFAHHGHDLRLPEQQEVMLYCATHELVNNALKHAHAQHIMVQLMIDDEYAAVIVADDGHGFDPHDEVKSMGLRNIRERVEMQHGRMSIDSSGAGTEINIEIPR